MTQIKLFQFENKAVRTAIVGGELVWIAKDVAEGLDYVWNGSRTIKHVPEEWRGVTSVPTPSGEQEMAYLTENGIFFFLGRSDKPKALPFQKWVAGEVIPAIRQTGGYIAAAPQETSEELVLRAMSVLQATIERQKKEAAEVISRQQAQIDADAPKVAALEMLAEKDGELGIRDTGRELKVGQGAVREEMFMRGWACRQGRDIRPASYGLKQGYVRLVQRIYTHPVTGQEKVSDDFRVTRKGIARLAEIFASKG